MHLKHFLPKILFQPIFLLGMMLGIVFSNFLAAQTQTITTPGSGTFTVPAGVTSITVEVWGAGGSGGTKSGSNGTVGGGGGGAYSSSVITVTPGQVINFNVGFGALTTTNGEDTWFLSNTTLMAKGGNSVPLNSTFGASGGSAAAGYGSIKFSGGNGADANGNDGGGGGSSAGINANGISATNSLGAIAPTGGGNGGNGRSGSSGQNQGRGENGVAPGGGGGGSYRSNASGTEIVGGYGGNGQLRISYIALTSASGTDNQSVCEDDPIIETTYSFPPNSTVTISDLPTGLSSDINYTAGTISITGTPTTSGTYTIDATPPYNSFFTLSKQGTVTIIPRPDVTDMTETVCSGDLFTVTPTDGIDGIIPAGTTYSWDAPVISAGLTGGVSGSGN
ncbi:hypothetical protein JYB62_15690, partial [Algoriphagus lutimaris]|uniref:glycine-rich domain-containing protein n=1 Tax=Algoriphagus lutimaris TaxID=613197 RepID=UPI003742131F|nr:hypothetical protein [Algoriphagus lutimaris]